ncbi:MAG: hypothetical protein GC134_04045 [Proteobacteria bacterium]|nr:hypothetical protein [Pseudomonadota bacterium]
MKHVFIFAVLALAAFALAATQGYYMHTYTGKLEDGHYVVLAMILVCALAATFGGSVKLHEARAYARVRKNR